MGNLQPIMSNLAIIARQQATSWQLAAALPAAQVMDAVPTAGAVVLLTSYTETDVQWTAQILRTHQGANILPVVQTDAAFPFLSALRRRAQQEWANCHVLEWAGTDDQAAWRDLAAMIEHYFTAAAHPPTENTDHPQKAVLRARQALADVL